MCGGGGGGDGGRAAREARQREEERQARIKSGMSRIDAIFDGGTVGSGGADRYDPNASYVTADGGAFAAPTKTETYRDYGANYRGNGVAGDEGGGGGTIGKDGVRIGGTDGYVTKTRNVLDMDAVNSMLNNGGLFTGTEERKGFTDDFYDKRSQAYVDFATPQLEDQYKDASAALTSALSRSGQLRSTLAGDRSSKLQKSFATQRQSVVDKGREYANTARRNINASRDDAVSMLQASADPDAAVSSALNKASAARDAVPAFDPLAPVFQNATAGLGSYMQGSRMGEINSKVNNIYGRKPGAGSGSVVR